MPKPGFRVWQNVRVTRVPGFFETWVSIPIHIIVILADQRCNVAIGVLPNWYLLCTEVVCTKIVCIKEAVQIFKISNRIE